MQKGPEHIYHTCVIWTGNRGEGTNSYSGYSRNHILSIEGKIDVPCSSDPYFKGEADKHNPEDFLVSAISSCHMLWYLHLCADNGIIVQSYVDKAVGIMHEKAGGGGSFSEVTLCPEVVITDAAKIELADALHTKAGEKCFITNSCNFPVKYAPTCRVQP